MNLEKYGYKERTQKVRSMSMAEMRIGIIQTIMNKNYRFARIRVVNTTLGEVDEYSNLDEFILAEYNEAYEINFISMKEIDIYNEEKEAAERTFIILIEEAE